LFYAVDGEFGENADIVSFLLEKNATVEEKNKPKMTPLIKACQKNYINIVSMLLEKGADCNLQLEGTGIFIRIYLITKVILLCMLWLEVKIRS